MKGTSAVDAERIAEELEKKSAISRELEKARGRPGSLCPFEKNPN